MNAWQPYNQNAKKAVQDILLKDGRVIIACWPAAGHFNSLFDKNKRDIPERDVAYVRPTIKDIWK